MSHPDQWPMALELITAEWLPAKDTTNTMPLFAGRMMFEMGRM